jgi:hypothetical protein
MGEKIYRLKSPEAKRIQSVLEKKTLIDKEKCLTVRCALIFCFLSTFDGLHKALYGEKNFDISSPDLVPPTATEENEKFL